MTVDGFSAFLFLQTGVKCMKRMKTLSIGLLAACVLLCGLSLVLWNHATTVRAAETEVSYRGDVTGNGVVDLEDAILMQQYIVGSVTLTQHQVDVGDVNDDGDITLEDVIMISQYIVGVDVGDIGEIICEHEFVHYAGQAATCTEPGWEEYDVCTKCGYSTYQEIAPLGHNYTVEVTQQPTCTEEGERTYTCTRCGGDYSEVIPANGHTVVIDEAVAPTCTATGLTEGSHCSVCGTVLVEQEVVPMTGHTEVIDEAVAATCTQTGLTEGSHCSVCGAVLIGQVVVPMTGHTYTSEVTQEPTCSHEGETTYTCSVCGDSYTEDIPTIAHTEVIDEAVAATCTQTGLTEGSHCSVCGTVLVEQEVIPTIAHTYTREVTQEPTCEQAGETTYTCSVCGDSYTEDIPMTGHTEVIDEAVASTCTATGLTEGIHCSVCGAVLIGQVVVPMTGHTYTSEVTKEPTCEQAGETTYTCLVCGDSYTASTAALGHLYRVASRQEATCTQEGEVVYTCARCGGSYTEDIPMTAHNYVNGICATCGVPAPRPATEGLIFTLSADRTQYSVIDYTGTAAEVYIPAVYEGLPVTSIGDRAFYLCSSLTSIEIPDSVTSIGEVAFYRCGNLTSIEIPDSVTSIGDWAFSGCWNLTSVTIGNGVTSIGGSVFSGCSKLISITIPDSVTSIGGSAFSSCSSLTSITIPDSVTSIGRQAFYECSSLTSITIGDGVTSIGEAAFWYCRSLEGVYITDIAAWCAIDFNSTASQPLNYADNLYLNGQLVTELVIPDGVTSIGDYAFYWCGSLTSITIPDSITSIGYETFSGCSGLTSIIIPDSVTSIGAEAFAYCRSLTSITIGDGVTGIGAGAFSGCSGLTSVTFANTDGWWRAATSTATSGTSIPGVDLSYPSIAATYLRSTYDSYYWRRG